MSQNLVLVILGLFWVIPHINAQEGGLVEGYAAHGSAAIEYDTVKWQSKSYQVIEGEATVIEFKSNNRLDAGNLSEANTIIAFEIPDQKEVFSWTDAELLKHKAVYVQACRCQDRGIQLIMHGNISGQKLNDGSWEIELDIISIGRLTQYEYRVVKKFNSGGIKY